MASRTTATTSGSAIGGVEKFSARVLTDNYPMRAILDRFDAFWSTDEPATATTVIDVPDQHHLPFTPAVAGQIHAVARQAIQAVG